ncbi:MAG: peptidoglycan-binding protein [Myxococcales bacterium]|nr:peptidoglycan-binding protein [Myxococcales bacterium]
MPAALESNLLRGHQDLDAILNGDPALARGARGEAVRAVQRGLLALGYGFRGGADGAFGSATASALVEFRALHERVGAGLIDGPTLAALDRSLLRLQAVADYRLRSPRFTGSAALERVLAGRSPLPRRGDAVRSVQQALSDLQFSLPRFGADGSLGGETSTALRGFQRWQKIRPGGELSPLTMMALDQEATAPGERALRYPAYDRLIEDGWLTVTIGVGFDENDADLRERKKLEAALRAEQFAAETSSAGAPAVFTRALIGRAGRMRVRLVHRDTTRPEESFAEGLVRDAVTIYAGHARYGTGPDFDAKESAAENFVIGVGAPQHVTGALERGYDRHMNAILAGQPNDLLVRRFDPERYQLWAFFGCTTRNYLDELRALVDGKDAGNLDLLVSTRVIYWSDNAAYVLSLLRALLRGGSVNDVLDELDARARQTEAGRGESHEGPAFVGDGFGDNVAP